MERFLLREVIHSRRNLACTMLQIKEKDLNKIILIGDRVLIRPAKPKNRTDSGLFLPQGMHKKEVLYSGYVLKVGPGYPIPAIAES
ncbi:MAG: co-chaperone GroES family protein, partial [Saprospiraceae bacterium]|nr:co-chaperone GroES family protein [Saprospiraceae bacterium]